MTEEYAPNYFILTLSGTDFYITNNVQFKRIECIFSKTIEEICKETNVIRSYMCYNETCYAIPAYLVFYRLKEPECQYELVGMTCHDNQYTYLHLLKKKKATHNID